MGTKRCVIAAPKSSAAGSHLLSFDVLLVFTSQNNRSLHEICRESCLQNPPYLWCTGDSGLSLSREVRSSNLVDTFNVDTSVFELTGTHVTNQADVMRE